MTRARAPASVMEQAHGAPLMQVEVGGQLPQMWLGFWRLIDLEEQIDGILPVCIWRTEDEHDSIRTVHAEQKMFGYESATS